MQKHTGKKVVLWAMLCATLLLLSCTSATTPILTESGSSDVVSIKSLTVSPITMELAINGDGTFELTTEPKSAASDMRIRSLNPDIATVDSNRNIKAISRGQAILEISSRQNPNIRKIIIVNVPGERVNSVSVTPSEIILNKGATSQLTVAVDPAALSQECTFEFTNKNIATVSNTGLILSTGVGTTTIVVRSKLNRSINAEVKVIVVDPTHVKIVGVTLPAGITVATNGTIDIIPTVTPPNASNKNMTWSSEKSTVASVVEGDSITLPVTVVGKLTGGRTNGVTTVNAVSVENTALSAKVKVTVVGPSIQSVQAAHDEIDIIVGTQVVEGSTVLPAGVGQGVKWVSNDPLIASVNETNGTITGVAPGNITLNVYSALDHSKKDEVRVNVFPAGHVPLTGMSLISNSPINPIFVAKNSVNNVFVIYAPPHATVAGPPPANPSNAHLIWSSDNLGVATIQSIGGNAATITGVNFGLTTIRVTSVENSNIIASTTVQVIAAVINEVRVEHEGVFVMTVGSTESISHQVFPLTSPQDVFWERTGTAVTITNAGVMTAQSPGTHTVRARSKLDNNKTDSFQVQVIPAGQIPVSSISLNHSSLQIAKNGFKLINAEILPINASNVDVNWQESSGGLITLTDFAQVANIKQETITAQGTAGTSTLTASSAMVPLLTDTASVTIMGFDINSITATPTNLRLVHPQTVGIGTVVLPGTALDDVIFYSNNTAVATMVQDPAAISNGIATSVAAGQTIMNIRSKYHDGVSVDIPVQVFPAGHVLLNSISIAPDPIIVAKGGTRSTNIVPVPANATDPSATFSITAGGANASVDASGVVTGITEGSSATLKAEAEELTSITDQATVQVVEAVQSVEITRASDGVKVDSFLNQTVIETGSNLDLNGLVTTTGGAAHSNQDVTWSSNTKSVVTVDQTGIITALSPGISIVIARSDIHENVIQFNSGSVNIIVVDPVTSVDIDQASLSLIRPNDFTLTAQVAPATAVQDITWFSTNSLIATVDISSGKVTAVAAGTATIKAISDHDTSKSDSIVVTVTEPVASVVVAPPTQTIIIGETTTLTENVSPVNSNQQVIWMSADTSVATVTQAGVVTGVDKGTVVIKAHSQENPPILGSSTITVNRPAPTGVVINPGADIDLKEGDTVRLTSVISSDKADQKVTWTIADTSCASKSVNIDSETANGEVDITGSTVNGTCSTLVTVKSTVDASVTDTLTVTVTEHALYWGAPDGIYKNKIDSSGNLTGATIQVISETAPVEIRFAIDKVSQQIYYVVNDATTSKLKRADIDGSNAEEYLDLTPSNNSVTALNLDSTNRLLNMYDQTSNKLTWINIDAIKANAVITTEWEAQADLNVSEVRNIVVFPPIDNNLVVITKKSTAGTIGTIYLRHIHHATRGHNSILVDSDKDPQDSADTINDGVGLVVDSVGNIYFSSDGTASPDLDSRLFKRKLNGTIIRLMRKSGSNKIADIALDEEHNKLYMVNIANQKILVISTTSEATDQGSSTAITLPGANKGPDDIEIY